MQEYTELTIRQALAKAVEILNSSESDTPVLDAGVILSSVINKDMIYIYTSGEITLTSSQVKEYFDRIDNRRKGMPVQHITGKQEFMALEFIVDPSVLIPRADTEILVEYVIQYVNFNKLNEKDSITIVDICTGSGCIAVSLAHYLKNAVVYGIDISSDALKIARINAQNIGVSERVHLLEMDILRGFQNCEGIRIPQADIIVSNPPYIPSAHIQKLSASVRSYEPHKALDGGNDGLDFYRKIISEAPQYLKGRGLIAMEIGAEQSRAIAELIESSQKYKNICFHKDLAGIDRVVAAELIHSKA